MYVCLHIHSLILTRTRHLNKVFRIWYCFNVQNSTKPMALLTTLLQLKKQKTKKKTGKAKKLACPRSSSS